MDNRGRYAVLLEQLYCARSSRALTAEQEHDFACALEDVWNQLNERERQEVEVLTEQFKRGIDAPKDLGTDVVAQSHTHPRRGPS